MDCNLNLLYETFVLAFPDSKTRADLFHEWTKYNRFLRAEIGEDYVQWVNGSFVTQKINPKDIDVVSFIPYRLYEQYQLVLDKLWTDSWEREGIDAYFVKVYPAEHPEFDKATKRDYRQWMVRYAATKPDENFVQRQKGFLSIEIQ